MFSVGDFVLCASGGVWQVIGVDDRTYSLRQHETGKSQLVPLSDAQEIVRRVADKRTVTDAIDRVGFIPTIKAPSDKIRKELYDDAMGKYNEIEWIKVIKTVYLRKQDGRLMKGESAYADRARDFFHGEVSVTMGIPVGEVEAFISAAVSNDKW